MVVLGLLLLMFLFIVLVVAAQAIAAGIGTSPLTTTLVVLAVVGVLFAGAILGVSRHVRRRHQTLTAYLEAASQLISNPGPTDHDVEYVLALRQAALVPIPESATTEFMVAYGREVAAAVADQVVTPAEAQRLKNIAKGLELTPETLAQANLNGFMQGYSTLVADHRLTADEEAKLTDLREAFGVPDSIVQAQLAQADQLRRAREVSERPLQPLHIRTKLRKGEECYHSTPATQKKSRVARTYVESGVRHTERDVEMMRAGTLFVTNQRLLLVAEGTTTIKREALLTTGIDIRPDGEIDVVLTVDGRKAPYYFAFPEPYITLAYIERVLSQA